MTEPKNRPTRTKTVGTVLQILLGVAFVADLAFFAAVGFQLSDHVEITGLALASVCAAVLLTAVTRVARRIGANDGVADA